MYIYLSDSACTKDKVKFDTADHSLAVKDHFEQVSLEYKHKSITFKGSEGKSSPNCFGSLQVKITFFLQNQLVIIRVIILSLIL